MIKKIEKSHQARKSRTPTESGRAKDDIFAEIVLPELTSVSVDASQVAPVLWAPSGVDIVPERSEWDTVNS
jgi:hypothetical protein